MPKQAQDLAVQTGSLIVAVVTASEIVVGADSKAVALNETRDASVACKIIQVGKVFFASAKLAGDQQGRFDVAAVATESIQQGGALAEITTRFKNLIKGPVLSYLRRVKRTQSPAVFDQICPVGTGSVLDIVFFGIEDQTPTLYLCSLFNEADYDLNDIDASIEGLRGSGYIPLGHTDSVRQILEAEPDYFKRNGNIRGVKKLLEVAIEDSPEYVGGPICLLRIDKKSARWLERPAHCPPIKGY